MDLVNIRTKIRFQYEPQIFSVSEGYDARWGHNAPCCIWLSTSLIHCWMLTLTYEPALFLQLLNWAHPDALCRTFHWHTSHFELHGGPLVLWDFVWPAMPLSCDFPVTGHPVRPSLEEIAHQFDECPISGPLRRACLILVLRNAGQPRWKCRRPRTLRQADNDQIQKHVALIISTVSSQLGCHCLISPYFFHPLKLWWHVIWDPSYPLFLKLLKKCRRSPFCILRW